MVFTKAILPRFKNLELTNKAALGIAYGFETYDPKSPLPNDIISSKLNAFVGSSAWAWLPGFPKPSTWNRAFVSPTTPTATPSNPKKA